MIKAVLMNSELQVSAEVEVPQEKEEQVDAASMPSLIIRRDDKFYSYYNYINGKYLFIESFLLEL